MARMHTIAFAENGARNGLDNVAALTAGAGGAGAGENLFTTGNADQFRARSDLPVIWGGMFGSPNIARARLLLSSLVGPTQAGGYDIPAPYLNVGAEPVNPLPFLDWRAAPLKTEPKDGAPDLIEYQADNGNNAEDNWAFLWVGDQVPQPAPGVWRPLRFTTTASALTAEQWNIRALTATQTVRPGRYQVGGAWLLSTSARVGRLVGLLKPGGNETMSEKPGFPCGDAVGDSQGMAANLFRDGNLGVWGEFTSDVLPQVEVMADAADNEAQQVFLWVRKVA